MRGLVVRRAAFSVFAVFLSVILTVADFGWVDLINGCVPGPGSDRVLSGGYGTIAGIIIPVGILAQLRRPERQIATLLQVGLAALAFLLAGVLGADRATIVFGAILSAVFLLLWGLHPARRAAFDWQPRPNLALLVVALCAAGPLLVYAGQMAANQRSQLPAAAEAIRVGMGGWIGNTAMALSILLVAVLASLRPSGWRVSAWSAGIAAFLFGFDCLRFPSTPGSAGTGWGIAAMAWSIFFLAVAEWPHRRAIPSLVASPQDL